MAKPAKLPANIIALYDHYEDDESVRILDYKKTNHGEFLLIGYIEHTEAGAEVFSCFSLYKCDAKTGKRYGYIGSEIAILESRDCAESFALMLANNMFEAA